MCVFSVDPEELRKPSVSVDQPVSKCVCFQFILKNYVSQVFLLTDENLIPQFNTLVEYLVDKFKYVTRDCWLKFHPDLSFCSPKAL